MKINQQSFLLVALLSLLFGCSGRDGIAPNDSSYVLRQFGAEAMIHASMNGNRYPELEAIETKISKIEGLPEMIESGRFEYKVAGLDLEKTGASAIMAIYSFPGAGRMVLFTGGNTKWENEN